MNPRALALSLTALSLAAAAPARATATKTFHQATSKDFEDGEPTGTMILPTGEVVPGLESHAVETEGAAFVWCAALSRDGGTAYFGAGDDGKIFVVDAMAKAAGKDKERARRLTTLDAPWVTALAVKPDGTLLAATTPGGRLFSVDPKTGASKVLATLPAEHLWTLVYDDKSATAFVGTGNPGKIFAVDVNGKSRAVWDSRDKHVVALAAADAGHLFAGTSEEAILYRVGFDGRAEAVNDFEAEEVRAIVSAGGALYVAVNDFDKQGATLPFGPPAAKGTKIVITSGAPSPSSAGSLPRPGQRKSKAAVFRLERDGRLEQIFAIPDGYFTALAVDDKSGDVYAASGSQGRVFRIAPDRTAGLALDLPERQALALARTGTGFGAGFLVGTGDVGAVYRARPTTGNEATYLSKVFDGETRASWGLLRWRGSKGLVVETRSGLTSKPDDGWSAFARLKSARTSVDGGAGEIASPPSRYVQYRVTFQGGANENAKLDEITLAYLPQNQRARVTELTASDGSASGGQAPSPGSPIVRAHSSVLKLRWKVENLDGDELDYRLSYREAGEASWRPLGVSGGGADPNVPLLKPELDWNTEGLPDGTYIVRVVTSDERAQPAERALDSTFLSAPILVDNRKPDVAGLATKGPFVSGRARDDASPITQIEVAVDGADWHEVAPADGICDDLVEAFTVKLPALAPGPHAVTVRAWDSADNVGAASITVKGK
ncbi:MAG TPA: hypothetical protein VHJ20_17465 [Polyangia bacterium]|nr:hypothetical protein [Polyangia bacterium]